MKIGEAIAATPIAGAYKGSTVAYVFGQMYGAYGNQWLDKWMSGKLNPEGADIGVKSAMLSWSTALFHFEQASIEAACVAVIDPKRRPKAEYPPSLPEFLGYCQAVRRPPPIMIQDRSLETGTHEARMRIATIRLEQRAAKVRGVGLGHLHDLIGEAVQLAGGSLEELVAWQMVQPTGDRNGEDGSKRKEVAEL
jgi:hypothetical protein